MRAPHGGTHLWPRRWSRCARRTSTATLLRKLSVQRAHCPRSCCAARARPAATRTPCSTAATGTDQARRGGPPRTAVSSESSSNVRRSYKKGGNTWRRAALGSCLSGSGVQQPAPLLRGGTHAGDWNRACHALAKSAPTRAQSALAVSPGHTMSSELRVGNKYRLGRKIGSGSFGDIYLGARSSSLLLLRLAGRLALLSELRAVAVAVALRCRASCLHFEA